MNPGLVPGPATPAPPGRGAVSPRRLGLALLAGLAGLLLVGLFAYLVYVGAAGSEAFVHPTGKNQDCRTPAVRFGWDYEAINYDKADDARLAAAFGDMTTCTSQGELAGDEVVTADGIHIGGWYIPAESGVGPSGPTVVLVHGGAANKSEVLKYAPPFHEGFNIVAFDLRNGGRSSPADTTLGLREQLDVEAVIDWLERTKHPRWIGAMGNSMGAASALAAAGDDERVRALVLDSMNAQAATMVGRIFQADTGHPPQPGGWAIVIGVSLRIGADVTEVDPVRTITRLGDRPVLLVHGSADEVNRPSESAELNLRAALGAGVPVELEYCQGGTHGELIDRCPADWARWAVSFLDAAAAR
jgi:pimeloyl-ACP methyl ester carboxylesterase